MAGTLQPTYMLSDKAYLISTDYKNYAEVPRLIRHVNLNTSFETFVNYTSREIQNGKSGHRFVTRYFRAFKTNTPSKKICLTLV